MLTFIIGIITGALAGFIASKLQSNGWFYELYVDDGLWNKNPCANGLANLACLS